MVKRKIVDLEDGDIQIISKTKTTSNSNFITPNIKNTTDIVNREILAVTSTLLKGLTPIQVEIAKEYSTGNNNSSKICQKFNITRNDLDKLLSEPSFVAEVKRLTYTNGYADKDNRIRLVSRVIGEMSDSLLDEDFTQRIKDMPLDKSLKALKDLIELQNKMVEGEQTTTKIDITQIIKGNIEQDRIEKDASGKIKVKNKYPTIDESTGKVLGEFSYE